MVGAGRTSFRLRRMWLRSVWIQSKRSMLDRYTLAHAWLDEWNTVVVLKLGT